MTTNGKRLSQFTSRLQGSPPLKKLKIQARTLKEIIQCEISTEANISKVDNNMSNLEDQTKIDSNFQNSHVPLAEKLRPQQLNDYIGQKHLVGPKTLLNDLLKNGEIPSMILWGPPGCGKV